MPRVASAAPKKQAAPKSTQLAEKFPKDIILKDNLKKEWRLGDVIGQGGFGLVYHANPADSPTSRPAQYVIKIEPNTNGPLFCEMNFYIRASKEEFIKKFVMTHKLKYLAVPPYIGSGLHIYKCASYRFLVIPRYGKDLQKLLQTFCGTFSSATVFAIGLRMIDALQYLHEKEYVHADIKASNILLGFDGSSENPNQVYLADFGLAYRYTVDGKHKAYKADPRSAHNGTLEFTSRDAHHGAFPSRRGDMEILGYCLLKWMCGKLPWDSHLSNPNQVAQSKEQSMADVSHLIKGCFSGPISPSSECIQRYMLDVSKLRYEDEPNYGKLKDHLKSGLTKSGQKDEWKINFDTIPKASKRRSQDIASPRAASPKMQKTANKGGRNASPASKRKIAISPMKKKPAVSPVEKKAAKFPVAKKGRLPTNSPLVNGMKNNITSPAPPKGLKAASPLLVASRKSPSKPRKRFDPERQMNAMQLPRPSTASSKQSLATSMQTATSSRGRRLRSRNISSSDASIQTTPGLKTNI